MLQFPPRAGGVVLNSLPLLLWLFSATASAQPRAAIVFADIGFASVGHADSEQGKAPLAGGGVSLQLTPWLVVEGDVHRVHVSHVFGRDEHDFTAWTTTGSMLFRGFRASPVRLLAGGGLAVQRAHIDFDISPVGRVERRETLRLFHGRTGVEWEAWRRVVIRSDAVVWLGGGLDWIMGGVVRVGYRF